MKFVVITGSTRGIGRGLAEAFLERGHAVVINGRSADSVSRAMAELNERYDPARLLGHPADVTEYMQVEQLWQAAVERFGQVDIWINNAGLGNMYRSAWEQSPDLMQAIVETNLLGVMNGTHLAYNRMCQQDHGAIYNMEGFGSNGRKRIGLTVYGSTKYAVSYYTESLIDEVREAGSPVLVGTLSPGMVVTDLLTDAFDDPAELERSKRIFNILADRPETVTPWLVDEMLANTQQGRSIKWLTQGKIIWRFLTAPFNHRDLFSEED
jgi:NAD(P)-dependent dehydrogenase (short-subunit alcohol dehydrogenase family)